MIAIKPEILTALESNQALIDLLGGPKIYHLRADRAATHPKISFFEITNFDDNYADDRAISSEIHIQIDIWAKADMMVTVSTIAVEVDKTMKQLGFKRTAAADLYEDDTAVFHKALRYYTNRELEE